MEPVVMHNLPFNFVTYPSVVRLAKLKPISVNTLRKYIGLTVKAVEQNIALDLPPKFGLMFDGWSHQTDHYVAVYAIYSGELKNPAIDPKTVQTTTCVLLSMGVIMDDWHNDMSASSHYDYICWLLTDVYNRKSDDILFIAGTS